MLALAVGVTGDVIILTGDPQSTGSDRTLAALGRADGTLRWRSQTPGTVNESPAVAGGVVYVASHGALQAVNIANGRQRWRLDVGDSDVCGPAVGGGLVFAFAEMAQNQTADLNDWLYALPA